MNICAETQGCLEIDPDTSDPTENCVYSKLIAAGFSSDILCSADEKDSDSIIFCITEFIQSIWQTNGNL